jgi:hypothetical protein
MGEARGGGRLAGWQSPAAPELLPRCALDRDIAELNLEPISYLVALEQDWSLDRLDDTELEYRCFLQLVRDHPDDTIVPSRDCDTYWHNHILALGLYLEHCQALFGAPLLHYPFSGLLSPEDEARQRARMGRAHRLHAELVSRVRAARHREFIEEGLESADFEITAPAQYLGAAQGA